MSPEEKYQFASLDAARVADSPELPEMFAALLELYRSKCRSEVLQQETIQSLLNRLYGAKSEKSKYHPDQKLLLPELLAAIGEEPAKASVDAEPTLPDEHSTPKKSKSKGAHGRSKLPAHLERRVVDRIDDVSGCEACGRERPILRVEKSERLNYIPARAVVDVTETVIRGPLPCACNEDAAKIVRPERPIRPLDRGMPGVELLSAVVIGKYLYHLPHYRQATKTLKDAGITLSKQTLWDWTRKTAELLDPLWELMREKLLEQDHLAADETTVQMVDRDKPGTATKKTYFWQYFGFDDGAAPYTVFDFAETRAHTAPKQFLNGYSGTLLTDGYSAYHALEKIIHACCMAHARRKFDEAMDTSPVIASRAIALIGKLYAVENECADLNAEERADYRSRHSTGHLLRLRLFLEQERPRVMPRSNIGKAIQYALNQWTELCRFVDDGQLPIDNNAVEREMKAIATGRKNWRAPDVPRLASRGSQPRDTLLAMSEGTVAVWSATCI